MTGDYKRKVGDMRRSQVLYNSGVGGILDLPNINAVVMGLHRWQEPRMDDVIPELRVLAQVRRQLGDQVEHLALPQVPAGDDRDALDPDNLRGVPVQPFPNWLRCPRCSLLARRDSGHFQLKHDPYRPDRTRYEHISCPKSNRSPTVTPSRFMVACENGHLSDFPWHEYLGCAETNRCGPLRFFEKGVSSEVADLWVSCDGCGVPAKPMVHAFGDKSHLPTQCHGLHPHLGDDVRDAECSARPRTMLVGASNQWFPVTCMALSLPTAKGRLEALMQKHWAVLEIATSKEILAAFQKKGDLDMFRSWPIDEIWEAVEQRRGGGHEDGGQFEDLKIAEWLAFSDPAAAETGPDFRLREVDVPEEYRDWIQQVVLVERLRVVKALTGFTRIVSPGDFVDPSQIPEDSRVRLSRALPTWVPAAEVRGEGIFLQLREDALEEFLAHDELRQLDRRFLEAHTAFRRARRIEPASEHYPGLRYTLLHTLSHLLIRQLAIECGYSAASVAERIYSRLPGDDHGPMAGILLYTAASDSEGTLGGLVALGQPLELGRNLGEALRRATLCSSDPLCAEHPPDKDKRTIHGAACHACTFVSETSCERGNKYLDRTLLVPTMAGGVRSLFPSTLVES